MPFARHTYMSLMILIPYLTLGLLLGAARRCSRLSAAYHLRLRFRPVLNRRTSYLMLPFVYSTSTTTCSTRSSSPAQIGRHMSQIFHVLFINRSGCRTNQLDVLMLYQWLDFGDITVQVAVPFGAGTAMLSFPVISATECLG